MVLYMGHARFADILASAAASVTVDALQYAGGGNDRDIKMLSFS